MIQTQILLTNIIRVVWETEKRITYEILGVKGLKHFQDNRSTSCIISKCMQFPRTPRNRKKLLFLIAFSNDDTTDFHY